jgi:hypothetical protein
MGLEIFKEEPDAVSLQDYMRKQAAAKRTEKPGRLGDVYPEGLPTAPEMFSTIVWQK